MSHKKIDEPRATPPKFGEQNKRNQEPCHEMFWSLVSVVIECFKQNSFNDQNSPTESTGTVASGFTIPLFYFISRIYYRYWENSFYLSSWIYFKIIPFAIWYEHCAFYNYLFSLKPIFHLRSLYSSPLNLNERTQTKIKVSWRYQNWLLLFWIPGTGVSLKVFKNMSWEKYLN